MTHPTNLSPDAFDLEPSRPLGDAAALCVHGLTGTPYEVRPLAEALAAQGIRARGPLLPGHGSGPHALAAVAWPSWLQAVRQQYRQLRAEHAQVGLVGLSLGGLLCLALAQETAEEGIEAAAEPDALAVIGTPLALPPSVRLLVPLLEWFAPMRRKDGGSDIRDPAARARHPSDPIMPMASVRELIRLQRRVRPRLERIRAPILVAHGRLDTTANPRDAERIHRSVASSLRELLVCERSGHVVPVDYDGEMLSRTIAGFFVRAMGLDAASDQAAGRSISPR